MYISKPFLNGNIVYLRKPDLQADIIDGNWHDWFNDYETTRYLVHGLFPLSKEEEFEIVKEGLKCSNSLILTIVDCEDHLPIGVISLKNIDHVNRNAEIALVIGGRQKIGAAIESMALVTQHAFDRLNLEKIYAGQHEDLWKWVNTIELIGYQIEGFRKNFGRRDCKPYGIIFTGVTVDKFNTLRKMRNGKILGDDIRLLLKERSKENKILKLINWLESLSTV